MNFFNLSEVCFPTILICSAPRLGTRAEYINFAHGMDWGRWFGPETSPTCEVTMANYASVTETSSQTNSKRVAIKAPKHQSLRLRQVLSS